MAIKTKKECKICHKDFKPHFRNGIPTSGICNGCKSDINFKKPIRFIKKSTGKSKRVKTDVEKLETKLWTIFSKWVRLSNTNAFGFCRCYTCGVLRYWKKTDAGHYIKREHHATKFDERNVKPQCRQCNRFKGGQEGEFATRIVRELGAETLLELNRLKHSYFKFTEKWLSEKIEYYKKEVKKYER